MCGIWAIFGYEPNDLLKHCGCTFPKIKHRGPDAWRLEYDDKIKNCCVGFHRLTIVDCTYGMQPMRLHQFPHSLVICNGELYNCKNLQKEFGFDYETYNDVECVFQLYQKLGIEGVVRNLDGVFAFCIIDVVKRKVFLGRDPYGVRPLFRIYNARSGLLALCSEAKGIVEVAVEANGESRKLEPFPPGTFEEYDLSEDGSAKLVRQQVYHRPGDRPSFKPFISYEELSSDPLENIQTLLTSAVRKRLMADRRIGCFLSGGLDSSLIAALLVQEAKKENISYKIQSFSIGMNESPDIKAAREVARYIGTEHHEVTFTEDDIAEVLDDVIYTLETADITTIRASIGMFLISRYVLKNTDTTVVFSGEGADELCQGYIYFRDAPSAEAGHEESLRLLREIYLFDGLRADRTTSSQSLELRVPFLDLQFTNYFLSLPKKIRQPKDMKVEKHLLRSAFEKSNLLPHHILWRHKEAFSDGVASENKSLFTIIQEIIDRRIPAPFDATLTAKKYPHCTPKTKEAYYYREVFEKSYSKLAENFLPFYWMPRWINVADPSARFISHYAANPEK